MSTIVAIVLFCGGLLLNSNSLNLLAGAYLPTFFASFQAPSGEALLALGTLLALTAAATAIGIVCRGFGRVAGLSLVGVYAAYAAISLSRQI